MNKTGMTLLLVGAVLFSVLVAVFSIVIVLFNYPSGIGTENENIVLASKLGKPQLIPVNEISIMEEVPEGLLSHLIRTNGTSTGKVDYGYFKNTKTGQKMFLYLTGKEEKVCFEYNGLLYVVDDWR